MIRTSISTLVLACAAALLIACASNKSGESQQAATDASAVAATVRVEPGQYALTFDETRELLRDLGFMLDRVDAQMGVIATQPKGTGGIFTLWDREQSSLADELEDAGQRQRRVVRVEFVPEGAEPGAIDGIDLRTDQRPMDAIVTATVQRLYQPGWRPNALAILESSYTRDPELDARGMGAYAVTIRQDDDLARWLADQIRARAQKASAAQAAAAVQP